MEQPTTEAKITDFIKEQLLDKQRMFIEQLTKGGLYAFEESPTEVLQRFFNLISEELLAASAQSAEPVLRAIAKRKRMGKLVKRPLTVQLKTGHYVSVEGLYAKTVPAQHLGVQVAADGAPWIWNRVSPMLIRLGVGKEKIVELVDYYHAAQYVHKIVQGLPKKLAGQSAKILKEFKEWLWQGNIRPIVDKCEKMFARPCKEIKQYIGYLSKNENRMQYANFRADKLMCGSGIIESGIRRVINLRFKNSSAFWKQENVECMYFLRGILLSYRWKIMMNNFVAASI